MSATGTQLNKHIKGGVSILMDYGKQNLSYCRYDVLAADIVPVLANYLAYFISKLNISLDNLLLIGHSLGGQVVGLAGARLNGKVAEIIVLDVAGPSFENGGMNASCAQFVQALHTDRILGKYSNIAHLDVYANDCSMLQPGCSGIDHVCSHLMAPLYFYSSIFHEHPFLAGPCKCAPNSSSGNSRFGIYKEKRNSGVFCFNTTACFPYIITATAKTEPMLHDIIHNTLANSQLIGVDVSSLEQRIPFF